MSIEWLVGIDALNLVVFPPSFPGLSVCTSVSYQGIDLEMCGYGARRGISWMRCVVNGEGNVSRKLINY